MGVLVSGTGSLLEAIIDQADLYEVTVVLSDRPGVQALARAAAAGVPTQVVDWAEYGSERRTAFSDACARALRDHGVDLACSAGFMRILTREYFDTLGVPAMNSHPALLPSFPGPHGVRDALAAGVKVTGTTIHFQTPDVDAGPIILQACTAVADEDTEASLHERIKELERRLYPQAIRLFAQGMLKIEGHLVHLLGDLE